MRYEYNDPILKPRRKELRNRSTDAEGALWTRLQRGQMKGFKFVRQYSVGPYILDFFCPRARLAVELDGAQHDSPEGQTYDRERASYLEDRDIKVIRFRNREVMENLEGILEKIRRELITPPPP